MKKVIEVLKESGTIGRIQKHFNEMKVPKDAAEEDMIKAIRGCVCTEMYFSKKLEGKVLDALLLDMAEAVKSEIHIEPVGESEKPKDLASMFAELLEIMNSTTRKE